MNASRKDNSFSIGTQWLRIKDGKEIAVELVAIWARGARNRYRVIRYEFQSLKSGKLFEVSSEKALELFENGELKLINN